LKRKKVADPENYLEKMQTMVADIFGLQDGDRMFSKTPISKKSKTFNKKKKAKFETLKVANL
jgi:hypothetical protein